ncbi:mitochondrial Mam33 family protein [Schizosaccharomyces osmophilus]|uniref:Mitochondrial Mam33 family protein n=1 Tax=Schizosaccharomyces osmophilus TaxID=2545709 RepID=A0AAE9W870_9SCHI|nr:mitochondrial Mam33 family protein [Schizosaccharomyces osmophilus]WBW70656.1 mitochondrial Mam33 family protein [Schizosaccharomyces osmophilus]
MLRQTLLTARAQVFKHGLSVANRGFSYLTLLRPKRRFTSGILMEQLALKLDSELGFVNQVLRETTPNKEYENALRSFTIHENPLLNYIAATKELENERIRITVPVYSARASYTDRNIVKQNDEGEEKNGESDELSYFQQSIPTYVQITNNEGTLICSLILNKDEILFDSLLYDQNKDSSVASTDLAQALRKSSKYRGRKANKLPDLLKSSLLAYLEENEITAQVIRALISRIWRKENLSYKSWLENILRYVLFQDPSKSAS